MNERSRQRLAALLLPILDGEAPMTDAAAEEMRALLAPPPPPWPHEGAPVCAPVAREEYPLAHLNADYGRF